MNTYSSTGRPERSSPRKSLPAETSGLEWQHITSLLQRKEQEQKRKKLKKKIYR